MVDEILPQIIKQNDAKIIQVVLDGAGGIPFPDKTAFELADIPNLDSLAKGSACGLLEPVMPGVTPGSGPGHLGLFGYDPIKYQIGRGVLEALGVGMHMQEGDIAARGNFATLENGVIVDRRAGRISTERNKELCKQISDQISQIEDVDVIIEPGKEHRFAVIFRGDALSEPVSDADPQKAGNPPKKAEPLDSKAEKAARIINKFIRQVTDLFEGQRPTNTVLMRGFANPPQIPSFQEDKYKLKAGAIANYPMYVGLARLVGMDIVAQPEHMEDEFDALEENYDDYDYFYLHIKKTDSFGEDGNQEEKVKKLEKFDNLLPRLIDLEPEVIAVTSDHSTPSKYKSHSWHPVPFAIRGKYAFNDQASQFTENEFAQKGIHGNKRGTYLMPLILSNAQRFLKFGA